MSALNQIFAITLMNLKSIPQRLGSSMVIVVGIAGVVAVLVALLSMAKGFESTLKGTGNPARVIVMRGGATDEMSSGMSQQQATLVKGKPGIARGDEGAIASGETYIIADVPKRANQSPANMPLRGVEPASFRVRDEVRIVAGRNLEFGRYELIAGVKAADQFEGLDLGNELELRGGKWEVVGLFETGGTIHEGEVWVDNALLVANLGFGGGVGTVVATLEDAQDLDMFKQALADDPQLETHAVTEAEYYSEQSTGTTSLITNFGYSIGVIMAIGAIFAALNTMYSAVSTRGVEIATLRALGFSPMPVVISVMAEALFLAVAGGAIGAMLAYLFFNGYTASTWGGSFSQVSFDFAVTPELVSRGMTWSCLLGLIGGLVPSITAARQPVTIALRGR